MRFGHCLRVLLPLLFILGAGYAPPATGTPVVAAQSDTVTFSDWQFPYSLNPLQDSSNVSADITSSLFARLLDVGADGRLRPDLLAVVPTVKNGGIRDGGRTVVLRLKPDQRWSSGVEITNRDIRFGWRIGLLKLSGPYCYHTCDHITDIQLSGRYLAVLRLAKPWAPLLTMGLPPVLPHAWKALGETPQRAVQLLFQNAQFAYESARYWTSGPYQVREFVKNDHILLTPMPFYRAHPKPEVARLYFRFFSDKAGMMAAAAVGTTDVTTDYSTDELPVILQHQQAYRIILRPSFTIRMLEFNVGRATHDGRPNPVRDPRVRQALALALDRRGLTASALGLNPADARRFLTATPYFLGDQRLGAGDGSWDPIARRTVPYGPRAIADARTLLQRAGYGKGLSLVLLRIATPTVARMLDRLNADWGQVGVGIAEMPFHLGGCFFPCDSLHTGDFEVALLGVQSGPDPEMLRTSLDSRYRWLPGMGYRSEKINFTGISDPVIDASFQNGVSTINHDSRRVAYARAAQRLSRQAYWIPLYRIPRIVTVNGWVHGVAGSLLNPDGYATERWHVF